MRDSRQVPYSGPVLDRLLIIAPAAPGGGWDQTARAMQHALEVEGLVRVVEVQNVAGAAGTIGLAQFIDTHRGDGHALLVSGLVMLGATLWNDSPVTLGQATPIARLSGEHEVVAVPTESPHRGMDTLVEALRASPAAVSWGGGSAGGTDHILAGLIAAAAGVDPRRVNYIAFSGGGEAVAALLGGNVTAGVSGYSEFAPHIESGRLRALGISAPERLAGITTPTLREQGVDVELANWRALLGAPDISGDDRRRLIEVVERMVRSATWRKTLGDRGWTDISLGGDAFGRYLDGERVRVSRVVARLRGPSGSEPVRVGQRIFPIAIFSGAGIVAILLLGRAVQRRGRRGDFDEVQKWRSGESGESGEVNQKCNRLVAGLVLLSTYLSTFHFSTFHLRAVFLGPSNVEGSRKALNGRAIGLSASGLIVFVLVLEPLGFVVAASLLFILVARAFEPAEAGLHEEPSPVSPRTQISARTQISLRTWISRRTWGPTAVGSTFALIVYLAFTRGLDLALPAGTVWAWMR